MNPHKSKMYNKSNTLQTYAISKKRRKAFTPEEDQELNRLVKKYGTKSWELISSEMKTRNVRQCRERWKYYLSPNVNRSPWTSDEDHILYEKYNEFGPKWSIICKYFHGRSLNNVKNRWNSIVRKIKKLKLNINSEDDFYYCGKLLNKTSSYQMKIDDNEQILSNEENSKEHQFDPLYFLKIDNLLNQLPATV